MPTLHATRAATGRPAHPVDSAQWSVWTTTARVVVTDPAALARAQCLVRAELEAVDLACSRFRPDSELSLLRRLDGAPVRVSPLLADLVQAALDAAGRTGGAVDPTVGAWLESAGYPGAAGPGVVVHAPADYRAVRLERDRTGASLVVPPGVVLDLGATGKAYAADLCAALVARRLDTGVLVSLGGDIATAGPGPDGGWPVLVQDRDDDPAQAIRLPAGGALATSSTVSRRWLHEGTARHHIVDPRTGGSASTRWRSVSVAAGSCVDANAASTAALVHGDAAIAWLRRTGLPARLVAADRTVTRLGAWPQPSAVDSPWVGAGGSR